MNYYKIDVGDKTLRLPAQKIGDFLWFHYNGKTYQHSSIKKKSYGSSEYIKNPEIIAPMPGKILSVNCKVGDELEEGYIAIVMEAMKMEYSLKTSMSGEVVQLNCQVGEQVSQGQCLLNIRGNE